MTEPQFFFKSGLEIKFSLPSWNKTGSNHRISWLELCADFEKLLIHDIF